MQMFKKIALALVAASFCAAPALAADIPGKPDPAAALKSKANSAIEKGKEKLAKDLGLEQKAPAAKGEEVQVNEETVTVETPQGAASETTVTVTPETSAPATPAPAEGAVPGAPEAPAPK